MKTRNQLFLFLTLGTLALGCSTMKAVTWPVNALSGLGGYVTDVIGSPTIIQTENGKPAVQFDGADDGLLVQGNPIAGAQEFSIEVEFKPTAAWPANKEQRFLHIEDLTEGKRRVLLELRLNNRNQWYADFFLRHENGSKVLIDSTKTHPVGEWATMKLTYKDRQLKGYVNGILETQAEMDYLPIPATASVSLGTRMDKRSWFNGAIRRVTFRKKVE
ncbi:LamG-like jellyroll fold domain-containing protein [Rufibacter sp. LB8]|uniref:LamG-like jellyroll fold domain-containing protein n=1 Tax=Rufibacter sp. LB8 TaxID=2777781 RepID=UPI00178C4607|nr:LamG-like jellyroll fold domain-containing protein [Rufibacter sp. LB8]